MVNLLSKKSRAQHSRFQLPRLNDYEVLVME
jgi:hypothetical protein